MRCLIAALLMSMTATAWSAPPAQKMSTSAASSVPSADPWVDIHLADLDRYAARYQASFDDELVRYQHAPRELILALRKQGWTDSRIYAACVIGRIAGRPCRLVADAWEADRDQPWDAVAARFGVTVGSNALDRLNAAIRASYKRWSRPLAA